MAACVMQHLSNILSLIHQKKNEKCVAYKKKRVNVFVILGKQYGVNGFSQFSQLPLILYLSAWMSKTSELHFFICYS